MDRIIRHNQPSREPPADPRTAVGMNRSPGRAAGPPPVASADQVKLQMQQLAWLMDESIRIPILGMRVGVDGLLGLIPGVGDLISASISAFIIRQAHALGVPKVILLRMSFNTAIDFVIGSVPLVGDLFDIGWKANKRNVRLVLEHLENPARVRRSSWLSLAGMSTLIILVAVAALYSLGALFAWLFTE